MNKKLFFISLLLLLFISSKFVTASGSISEQDAAGQFARLEGVVLLRADNASKPSRVSGSGQSLLIGNQVRTRKDARAYIKWIDGSKILMREKSTLSIKAIDYFDVAAGQVMFDITKIERPRPVRVGVKLSLLGIRGTQFVVDVKNDEFNVYLKEGKISITSLNAEFKIYKEQINAQMKQFREQLNKESDKFKSRLESDFKKFKKDQATQVESFDLIESAGISIKDNVITLVPIPEDILLRFELLNSF